MVLVFSAIFFTAGPYLRLTARNASISCKAVDFIDSLRTQGICPVSPNINKYNLLDLYADHLFLLQSESEHL